MTNPCLEAVTNELDNASVPYRIEHGGKHIRVLYGEDYQHLHVVAATPSDWRAPLNDRAQIRRDMAKHGFVAANDDSGAPEGALISLTDGKPCCFSYDLADRFRKAHKNVLRDIDKIRSECGAEFDRLNFEPIDYLDAKGRKQRAYRLTRDGFSLVVMGFTGSEATTWKIKYIDAFNAMEDELRRLSVVDHSDEIKAIREEVDAAVTLMLEASAPAVRHKKPPFIRPSIIRRQKQMMRARS
ncbi:Rha family transcriptional regulator [Shinella pollutisoli]|uniref:Rha family transcriptional regulator n=1 Tax=Shinella pollutisoli TaxID=2250594 RepID=A0ABV7DBU4_9HYPH|nr:Rha family transcriptional regulator [Shinella pollutisoli]